LFNVLHLLSSLPFSLSTSSYPLETSPLPLPALFLQPMPSLPSSTTLHQQSSYRALLFLLPLPLSLLSRLTNATLLPLTSFSSLSPLSIPPDTHPVVFEVGTQSSAGNMNIHPIQSHFHEARISIPFVTTHASSMSNQTCLLRLKTFTDDIFRYNMAGGVTVKGFPIAQKSFITLRDDHAAVALNNQDVFMGAFTLDDTIQVGGKTIPRVYKEAYDMPVCAEKTIGGAEGKKKGKHEQNWVRFDMGWEAARSVRKVRGVIKFGEGVGNEWWKEVEEEGRRKEWEMMEAVEVNLLVRYGRNK